MAKTCTKCGEALIGTGRFCASCGTAAPPPSAFNSTMQSQTNEPKPRGEGSNPPAARPSTTSPVTPRPPSASNYGPPPSPINLAAQPGYAPPVNAPGPVMAAAATYAPYGAQQPPQGFAPAPQGYANYAPPNASPPPPYGPAFVVGARVLVQWADGNRYPGVVQQIATAHCLIGFPDGQLRWVEPQYLALAI